MLARRRFRAQRRQQFLPDLDRAGAPLRGRYRVIGRRKGQLGIVDRKPTALDVEQAARAAEIVQQMPIDMEKIGILTQSCDDMLVPDLGQHGAAGRLHCRILPFFLLLWQVDAPPPAVLHGLPFRSAPELASDNQNISEPLGQRLIWWARPHTGAGRRQIEVAQPNPSRPPAAGDDAAVSGRSRK